MQAFTRAKVNMLTTNIYPLIYQTAQEHLNTATGFVVVGFMGE